MLSFVSLAVVWGATLLWAFSRQRFSVTREGVWPSDLELFVEDPTWAETFVKLLAERWAQLHLRVDLSKVTSVLQEVPRDGEDTAWQRGPKTRMLLGAKAYEFAPDLAPPDGWRGLGLTPEAWQVYAEYVLQDALLDFFIGRYPRSPPLYTKNARAEMERVEREGQSPLVILTAAWPEPSRLIEIINRGREREQEGPGYGFQLPKKSTRIVPAFRVIRTPIPLWVQRLMDRDERLAEQVEAGVQQLIRATAWRALTKVEKDAAGRGPDGYPEPLRSRLPALHPRSLRGA
jgi:hypothetical protein